MVGRNAISTAFQKEAGSRHLSYGGRRRQRRWVLCATRTPTRRIFSQRTGHLMILLIRIETPCYLPSTGEGAFVAFHGSWNIARRRRKKDTKRGVFQPIERWQVARWFDAIQEII